MNVRVIMIGALALSLSGCMSVDGMRAKIDSGDARQIEEANAQILALAMQHNNFVEASEVCQYVDLVTDNEVLWKIHAKAMDSDARDRALSRLKFSTDEETLAFVKKHAGDRHNEAYKVCERLVMGVRDESALTAFWREMGGGAANESSEKAKKFGQATEISKAEMSESMRELLHEKSGCRLAEIATDQSVLTELATTLNSQEHAKKAARKVTEVKYLLQLAEKRPSYLSADCFRDTETIGKFLISTKTAPEGTLLYLLIDKISDQKLIVDIALHAKNIDTRAAAAKRVKNNTDKPIVVKGLVEEWVAIRYEAPFAADQLYAVITELTTTQDLLKTLVENIGAAPVGKLEEIVGRITDSSVADAMYDAMKLEWSGSGQCETAVGIIRTIVKKMSKDKKGKLLAVAKEKAKCVKDKVVFEWFWVGMSAADFFVIADSLGVLANIDMYKSKKGGNWQEYCVVSEMVFPLKSCQKFLDCEDADILRQTIHKYVMHKDGKGSALEYLKLINQEVAHTETESFNLMSGFSTKHDFKHWETYSNSKLGTKIWFSEKRGVLRFTAL